jgi:hypothetical protein
MPLVLVGGADRRYALLPGSSMPIGRIHAGRSPEAMFVSRQQCMLSVSSDGTQVGHGLLLIRSTANSNTVLPELSRVQQAQL